MSDIPEQNSKPDESAAPKDGAGDLDVSNLRLEVDLTNSRVTVEEERKPVNKRAPEADNLGGIVNEGAYSALYSLNSTGKGVLQLVDKVAGSDTKSILPEMDTPADAEFGSGRWAGQQIGGALGIAVPFVATHSGVKRLFKPVAQSGLGQKASQTFLLNKPWKAAALEFGTAGAVFEFGGREVQPGQNFWETRAKNAGTGFATFSTLGASSVGLGQVGRQYVGRIANPTLARTAAVGNELVVAGGSGLPAGAVHALSHDYLHHNKLASLTKVKEDAVTFAVVGLGLGVKDMGMRKLGFENKTFYDHANEAIQNRSLNDNLFQRIKTQESQPAIAETAPLVGDTSSLAAKPTRVEAAKTKPTFAERVMANITGKGREASLNNRVLAEGENAGRQIEIDVPTEFHQTFNRGMEIADSAARTNGEAEVGRLVEFLNGEGAPIRNNLYEAAHLHGHKPMIDMFNGLFKISENASGIRRGEILAKAAARENAPQEILDAFSQYAKGEGVDMGHYLINYGRENGSQGIMDIAFNTYKGIEASPVAKQVRLGESIGELTARSTEAYKAQGTEIELVKIATETATSRLMTQLDPTQTKGPEIFDYKIMNERMQEFERGLEILTKTKRDGTEVDATQLSDYAKGDGAKVGQALLEWAHLVDNPAMVKQIETAYGMEANGMSGVILGEALAKASARPDAPEAVRDRFQEYANDKGDAMGEYLLDKAVELNDPNMEFVVTTTYAKNLDSPLGAALNRGGQLVDLASGLETARVEGEGGQSRIEVPTNEMADLINFAMTEGSNLGRALEYGAVLAGNPRAQTVVREAYLFAQGRSQRNIGDARLQVPEFISVAGETKVPFPTEKLGEFLELVGKDLPTTPEQYAQFRKTVMDYIIQNPEMTAKINNELSPHNGMTVAEVVAAQTQHSMIAGPIDFLFKSNNGLSRFGETAAQPKDYSDWAGRSWVVGSEGAPRNPEFVTARKFAEFESASGMEKQVLAAELMSDFGTMTPGQFKQWLEFAHQRTESGKNMTNLTEMTIPKSDVLARAEVKDALTTDATGDGVLNSYRKMLSENPSASGEPIPFWVNNFISRSVLTSRSRLGESATANQVLADALPKWLLNKIGERVEMPADGTLKYDSSLGADLLSVLQSAAKADRPGLEKLLKDKNGNRDLRSNPEETTGSRLDTLEQVLNVKDSELAGPLLTLGSANPQALRQILGKLNPETSAPEYAELVKLVLPKAESITDVSLLLDTLFVGNKAQQAGRKSKRNPNPENTKAEVESYQQLAMNALNVLVEPGTPGHKRANEIVEGIIQGSIRDPFKPRDNNRGGGRFGDRGGGQSRNFGGGNRGRNSKEGGD